VTTPTPPDPADRLAELEAELARVKFERDLYKSAIAHTYDIADAYRSLTPEELDDMLHGPRGQPLKEIIAEFEQRISS
jgi:hypothetical protein